MELCLIRHQQFNALIQCALAGDGRIAPDERRVAHPCPQTLGAPSFAHFAKGGLGGLIAP